MVNLCSNSNNHELVRGALWKPKSISKRVILLGLIVTLQSHCSTSFLIPITLQWNRVKYKEVTATHISCSRLITAGQLKESINEKMKLVQNAIM